MDSSFFQKYQILKEDTLIIACSGGPDSMYLLEEMAKKHQKNRLIIAHFNHNLRGTESDEDEIFLRKYCKKKGFIFESIKKDIRDIARDIKKGIEETARIERTIFLEQIRQKYSAKYILTAHHGDDSIETLIFNLIRGTKLGGLMGIPEKNQYTLRPLLTLSKSEILSGIKKENIPFRFDSSNADDVYLRNHLRINIIPEFEKINPEYRKNLSSFMSYMTELNEFIDTQVQVFLQSESSFIVEDFQIISPFLQREIIRYLYKQANFGTIGLSEGGIAEIIRFISDKGNYTKKELGKLSLEKKNSRIYFDSHS